MNSESRIDFSPLQIKDSQAIILNTFTDERGTLTRIWEENLVLNKFALRQASIVNNPSCGTLRGLHFQDEPYSESKVIQCVYGKVFDVIVDLRKNSDTYKKHLSLEIGPNCEYQGVLIPRGCAHGYLTLEPNSTLIYFMNNSYSRLHTLGIRWDDTTIDIKWPCYPKIVSEADSELPYFSDLEF
jgi:dTDP-4-dehydrorhamnose 3,5-epimerase